MFLDHTQRRSTVGRTPLDEWSARRRDLHLTTHNTHNRQTSMPPVGFEPTLSQQASGRQTYALDRAATGTGAYYNQSNYYSCFGTACELTLSSHWNIITFKFSCIGIRTFLWLLSQGTITCSIFTLKSCAFVLPSSHLIPSAVQALLQHKGAEFSHSYY